MAEQTIDPQLFERIVQEVIRRLMQQSLPSHEPAEAGRELVLQEKLVTLATLDQRLHGLQRLVVPCKAVVTPAAKDELKQRGIQLVRRS